MSAKTTTATRVLQRMWWAAPLIAAALVALLLTQGTSRAASAPTGLPCTTSQTGAFDLTAQTGHISTPDGNTLFMWSYAVTGNPFQYPGPILCVTEGQAVTITIHNTLPEETSLVFPGQDDVQANGSPSQPVFVSGALTSLAPTAAAAGGTATYSFTANNPGTYVYESGTDQGKQIEMGLVGALVVRPAGHDNWVYGDARPDESDTNATKRTRTQFNPQSELVMLLSEADPALHQAVERNRRFDITTYHPRYFFINGRSFPDTIAPDFSPTLPAQPYSSLLRLQPYDAANAGNPWHSPGLVRYLNLTNGIVPFHPHGIHGRILGRDGRELIGPNGEDLTYEKFGIPIGPGQTLEATYKWTIVEPWISNPPLPVTLPAIQNLNFEGAATYYGGSPFLGQQGPLQVGTTTFNECGEYYHVMHSHSLPQATTYGTPTGGMLTLMRIDPPGGCP